MIEMDTKAYAIENGLPCFTLSIKWDSETNKKKVIFPANWQKIREPVIKKTHNGFALLTGFTFWVLDFDNCFDNLPQNTQYMLWSTCGAIVKTRRGYHFYFKMCDTSKEFKNGSNIMFGGKKYDGIDVRALGGCILAPPSQYNDDMKHGQGEFKWISGGHY